MLFFSSSKIEYENFEKYLFRIPFISINSFNIIYIWIIMLICAGKKIGLSSVFTQKLVYFLFSVHAYVHYMQNTAAMHNDECVNVSMCMPAVNMCVCVAVWIGKRELSSKYSSTVFCVLTFLTSSCSQFGTYSIFCIHERYWCSVSNWPQHSTREKKVKQTIQSTEELSPESNHT